MLSLENTLIHNDSNANYHLGFHNYHHDIQKLKMGRSFRETERNNIRLFSSTVKKEMKTEEKLGQNLSDLYNHIIISRFDFEIQCVLLGQYIVGRNRVHSSMV